MNPAREELRDLSVRAWTDLAQDVQRAKGRAAKTGVAFVTEKPGLAIAGGALLVIAAAVHGSRKRRQPVSPPRARPTGPGFLATTVKLLFGLLRLVAV